MGKLVVLFDGYCVLCSGFAQWLHKRFSYPLKFIAMQSDKGQMLLRNNGFSENERDEIIVLTHGQMYTGSDAVLYILSKSNHPWRFLYYVLKIFPSSWIRWGYRVIAGNRYNWFGRRNSCAIIQD